MKTPAEFIVFALKQAKEAEKFGFTRNECCHGLKSALHQYWQNKTMHLSSISQKKAIPRSKAAESRPLGECRVEHTVPLRIIVNRLMDMESPTTAAVTEVLSNWYVVRLVTPEEDKRLTESGLRYAMPPGGMEWTFSPATPPSASRRTIIRRAPPRPANQALRAAPGMALALSPAPRPGAPDLRVTLLAHL